MIEDDGTKGAHGGGYFPPPQRYKDARAEAERLVHEQSGRYDLLSAVVAAAIEAIEGESLEPLRDALSALRAGERLSWDDAGMSKHPEP